MARVIFCVDWTDRIRRWMSRSVAMTLRGLDALGGDELGLGVGDGLAELLPEAVADLLLVADLGQDLRLPPLQPAVEEFLERPHGVHRQIVEQSLRAGEDDGHLLLDRQRLVLALLEELDHALAAGQLVLGGLVEVRPELREGRQLAVLREVEPQLAGHLAHGLDLGRAADARDREADVHGRPDAAVEEVGLQIDLAVGDRDHVGGDVGRHVAELGLDDRQRGERAAAERVVELGGALQQSRVQVEHVARVRLPARGPAQQQRELAIGGRVLAEVVVDAQRVALAVAKILAHGDAGVGGDVLQRRRLRGGGHDHRRERHRAGVLEHLHHLGHRRAFLADGDVEAEDVLALLVDDGVHADGGLAGAAVTDDELALTAPDRDHRVDGLEPRLQRFLHRAAVDDAGRVALDRAVLLGLDRALAVDRHPEGVDDAPDQRLPDRHLGDAVGPLDGVAFLDRLALTEQHDADLVLLEIEDHADDVVRKLQQLARHGLLEAVHARDAVADLDDATDLLEIDLRLVTRQLALDDLADLSGVDHSVSPYPFASRSRMRAGWPSRLPSTTRLPISATKPPRRFLSTISSTTTCLPPRARPSRWASAARSASVSGTALRTRARTRPRAASSMSR